MTQATIKQALAAYHDKQRREEAARRIERKTLSDYPASHNPYLPHEPLADCYEGCVR